MAIKQFTATQNKTVQVNGIVRTFTVPTIPEGLKAFINETEVVAGQVVSITEDIIMTFELEVSNPEITVNFANANDVTFNGENVNNGQIISPIDGMNYIDFNGATAIPLVQISGIDMTNVSVNGVSYPPEELPVTFQPRGGITNEIFVQGSAVDTPEIHIVGTDIESMTFNNVPVPLPFRGQILENTEIGVSGRIYQVDVSSVGGAKLSKDGTVISNGNTSFHQIVDINKDTYIDIDGTHVLTVDGEDVKSITVNGVKHDASTLPVTINNKAMTASVIVEGFEPSQLHIVGKYLDGIIIDGTSYPLGDEGSIDEQIVVREDVMFVNVTGSQPREYGLTFNDHDSTNMYINGEKIVSGTTRMVKDSAYIEAESKPIPVHFESPEDVTIEIDGRKYTANDFTFDVSQMTEIDVYTSMCTVTMAYNGTSYQMRLPQNVVQITAPQVNGWLFDHWACVEGGIYSPREIKTSLDLRGKTTTHVEAHYQLCATLNNPPSMYV